MHSLLKVAVVGSAVVKSAVLRPVITPAPSADLVKRQDPDAVSLVQVLLTAVPESLREIVATNLPAASSIIAEEFFDDKRPWWFQELPPEIQTYLIRKFGPQSAWPTATSGSSSSGGFIATVTVTASATDDPTGSTKTRRPSGTSERVSQSSWSSRSTTSTDRTNESTSFATSYTAAASQSPSSKSSESTSKSHAISSSINLAQPSETPSSTPTPSPKAPPFTDSGLSKNQKIGLGVGIPFGLIGAAALLFGCCALCRRRKKKNVEGSIPPTTPDFIPRFAFQEQYDENVEHRAPLNRDMNQPPHDDGTAWDDEGIDPTETMPTQNPYAWNDLGAYNQVGSPVQDASVANAAYTALDNEVDPNNYSNVPVMMQIDPKPIMAPALYHTHTSNRARGKRTSYTSLSSVTEVSEPDEMESPVLGRRVSPNHSPARNLMPTPQVPTDAQIKRKPVPPSPPLPPLVTSPSPVATSPAAQAASHKLLRQTMPEHSGSSSSGLALTTSTGSSNNSSRSVNAEPTSPISPVSPRSPSSNPFHYDSYVEDYGPEYQNGYVDVDDGLYGGNTSLSQYPASRRRGSKTEWPLRNLTGSRHRRRNSPLWERIYEE